MHTISSSNILKFFQSYNYVFLVKQGSEDLLHTNLNKLLPLYQLFSLSCTCRITAGSPSEKIAHKIALNMH